MRFWDNDYKTWMDLWEKSIDKLPSDVSITVAQNTAPILRLHNGHSISIDGDITSIAEKVYKELYEPPAWKANNPALKNKKENEDMPKIVDYKYNEENGTTTLFWADKTQTTVTADNLTEANQFEGFCAACAKKLFGNKSTYLNQFDKWTVKKPEQERKKAELEKAKAEEQAKIEAERAERAKEKEAERLAKLWAKQYKRENERIKIAEAAEKIAKDKYGIPDDWFGSDCCCECSGKEFDDLNTEDLNTEDITD